ncbi:MAG: glycoside hydrolase family 55 protein [Bacteroidales bacterium]|nr:glycoside hydrolase family 55 protein [Bacteroidales bacterium]
MRHLLSSLAVLAAVLFSFSANAGKSVFTRQFEDAKGVFFTQDAFGIRSDGKSDVSDALQDALNKIKEERGFGTLYLPEGKYLISRTIYVPGSIRIIGYGKTRPEIILEKNAPGFDKKETPMLWFTGGIVTDPSNVMDASAGTFYSGISNVDIRIGKGNPMAVGLRAHFAQHGIVSHVSIYGGDGFACLWDAGNELEDVEFFGARYGINSGTSSPSWPIAMVDAYFEGQKEAAFLSRNAGFAILNMKVKDCPAAVVCANGNADRLFMEDCYFENVKKGVVITGEEGETNQVNLLNIHCKNVPLAVSIESEGKDYPVKDKSYKIDEFVWGLVVPQMGAGGDFGAVFRTSPEVFPEGFNKTIPQLPSMDTWASVADYGATGDGETDDTQAIQKAIYANKTVFFPEGWYRITGTIKMREGSVLVGLHPFSTQLILQESTPAFSGFGGPVPMLESSKGGDDILTGIGICTGGYNKRAVGVKWSASSKSLLNDVKFVGGHGTMARPVPRPEGGAPAGFNWSMMGGFGRVSSPSNPIAVQGLDQAWDNQYWSLWITNGGGGTFKDIWSANTYASAGFYVSDTSTPSKMIAVSVEHHVRFESRWRKVSNFKVYALQYEEESREGRDCVSMTMDDCHDIMFANTWFYRVIRVMTPRDYGTLMSGCSGIEWRNVKAWTQILCETAATAYDPNKNISIFPLEFALGRVSGKEASRRPSGAVAEAVEIGDNYQFATGAATDSKGNVYFCEGSMRKIYKWDAGTQVLSLLADYPYRPLSLAVDTKDNLIVITRYEGQPGYTGEKIEMISTFPDGNSDYSGWGNGMWGVVAYAIDTRSDSDTMIPLEIVSTSSVRPERVIYPSHALRAGDFMKVYDGNMPQRSFLAPDGVTIIPYLFDLCRSIDLTAVTPGQKEPLMISWENPKRTYAFKVNPDGSLSATGEYLKHGEYATAYDKNGNFYLAEGQIRVYDSVLKQSGVIDLEERPISMEVGGKDGEYLFVTTNRSFYKIRIR